MEIYAEKTRDTTVKVGDVLDFASLIQLKCCSGIIVGVISKNAVLHKKGA